MLDLILLTTTSIVTGSVNLVITTIRATFNTFYNIIVD